MQIGEDIKLCKKCYQKYTSSIVNQNRNLQKKKNRFIFFNQYSSHDDSEN